MKYNSIKKIIKKIYLAFTIFWIILCLFLLTRKLNTNQLLLINFFGIFLSRIDLIFILASLILIYFIPIIHRDWKAAKSKSTKFGIIAILFLPLCVYFFITISYLNYNGEVRHYEFTSPNNKYNVVIEEISSLYGSNINFYKRKNPFAVDYLRASFPTYRDLSPLRKNLYRQKWRGNTFIFEGRNFHKKNGEWQRIEIDLENDEGVEKTERIDPMGNIIPEDKQSDKNNTNPTNHINSSNTKKYDKKKIIENYLKDISKYTIVEIPNTNYKIIEVDRVVASSLWYFVEKVDNKIIFISELPDSSPQVEGKIDSKEIIHLTFKDIHDNITKYKSSDKGKNWVEYK